MYSKLKVARSLLVWHLFIQILHISPAHHTSFCPHKGSKMYFETIQRVRPINITTLCSSESTEFIIYHSGPHLSILGDQVCCRHGFCSNLTQLCTEIRLLVRRGLGLECCLSSSSSCFPGVWMCVAPPSCLNRSLLKELARLPTNPLIPLQWGKGIETSAA